MKQLNVELPHKTYSIIIENGLLKTIGKQIKTFYKGQKIVIVTDENVQVLYAKKVADALSEENYEVKVLVIPAGEASKSLTQLSKLYTNFIDFELTRSDLIIALGGGVVGDLTGFAASTYLRGVSLVQIPTTLLSQVDSSVGGKVAINLPEGKNLVGQFYHPEKVLIDPEVLKTLEPRVLKDGMAEVIKYGCIKDHSLFNELVQLAESDTFYEDIGSIIHRCCDIKREIVEEDELDLGNRMLLNYGHTMGHGIEKAYGYKTYTHGEGVAIGMYQITLKSEEQNLTEKGTASQIKGLLDKWGLPTEVADEALTEIRETILNDKKRKGHYIHLVLLNKIGEAFLHKTEINDITYFI